MNSDNCKLRLEQNQMSIFLVANVSNALYHFVIISKSFINYLACGSLKNLVITNSIFETWKFFIAQFLILYHFYDKYRIEYR